MTPLLNQLELEHLSQLSRDSQSWLGNSIFSCENTYCVKNVNHVSVLVCVCVCVCVNVCVCVCVFPQHLRVNLVRLFCCSVVSAAASHFGALSITPLCCPPPTRHIEPITSVSC